MVTLQVSLTRLDKIIERLQELANNQILLAQKLAAPVPVHSALTEVQRHRLRKASDLSLSSMQEARWLLELVAQLQTLRAQEYSQRGIWELLLERDALGQLIKHYEQLKDKWSSDRLELGDVWDIMVDDRLLSKLDQQLSVNLQQVGLIDDILAELRQRVYQLTDTIDERSLRNVCVELPEDIAHQVAGKLIA